MPSSRTARAEGDATRRFGYLDPPYFKRCGLYGHHHPTGSRPFDGRCWDRIETHRLLIEWACGEFPDGWALSLSAESLQDVLELCPRVKVGSWTKGERAVRSNGPLSAWEPVIYFGGRAYPSEISTRRIDALVCGVAPRLTDPDRVIGAKPADFCYWMFNLLGALPGDELVDVFTGSGGVARAWAEVNRRVHQVPSRLAAADDESGVARYDGSASAAHDGSAPAPGDGCGAGRLDGLAQVLHDGLLGDRDDGSTVVALDA